MSSRQAIKLNIEQTINNLSMAGLFWKYPRSTHGLRSIHGPVRNFQSLDHRPFGWSSPVQNWSGPAVRDLWAGPTL